MLKWSNLIETKQKQKFFTKNQKENVVKKIKTIINKLVKVIKLSRSSTANAANSPNNGEELLVDVNVSSSIIAYVFDRNKTNKKMEFFFKNSKKNHKINIKTLDNHKKYVKLKPTFKVSMSGNDTPEPSVKSKPRSDSSRFPKVGKVLFDICSWI